MTYRAAPVTQRDGSALANSNCRMASIATGLDYHTLGAERSTGSKMRTYTDDQSGGTDSGDARQSWDRGYGESLTVRDGATFDQALADLRGGRLVHLDVWHASAGGPCLSGTGNYGHTMAVAPEQSGTRWLVADPWCSPGKWAWWEESRLRSGAEQWGGQVYAAASSEADWPTNGPFPSPDVPRSDIRWRIIARVVRALMSQYTPAAPAMFPPIPRDTGGGGRCLFTVTRAQASDAGGDDVTTTVTVHDPPIHGTVTSSGVVDIWTLAGHNERVELVDFPCDAVEYGITQSDNKAPKGAPFRRLAQKPWASYYVASSVVTYTPGEGEPPAADQYAQGWNDARMAVGDELDSWIVGILPPR